MKKGILFLMVLFIPKIVFANTISCSSGVYNADVNINSDVFSFGEDGNITINSSSEFEVEYEISDKSIVSINKDGIITTLKEGKTNVTVSVKFAGESLNTCKATFPISVIPSDTFLNTLAVDGYELNEAFRKDKYEYKVVVPYSVETINIIAEASSDSATVEGAGIKIIENDEENYNITVTSSYGESSIYKINVVKDIANSDNTLKNLFVEGYAITPKFSKNNNKYELIIDKDVDEIVIGATPAYEYAQVSGVGKFSPATGENNYPVTVTAENGEANTYNIVITKKNGSGSLKKLEINGYKLNEKFASDIYIYHVTIKSGTKSLKINAIANDNDEVEILNNDNFIIGDNDIIIKVKGKDKSTTTYKIIAKMENEVSYKKSNKLLKYLLILFVISVFIMLVSILIFLKNYIKKIRKRKNK